jgi:hypothetical protein
MTNNKNKILVVLVVVFALSSVGFGVAFGYGGGGGGGETIVLNTPNAWAVISPSKMLSAFNYTADISSILTYNASNRAFEVPSESDLLDPLNVFYVYPTVGTSISFTYENFMPGLTSRDLPTGWNLVGTNTNGSAIDEFSTIESSVSTLYVPETANARKDVTGASFGTSANRDISKTNWPSTLFDSHDGYWIYLINPATYSKILD